MNKKDIIICRCEDITLADLEHLLALGYTNIEEIKRLLRVGMGPCQGNTCGQIIQRELSKYLKKPLEEIPTTKVRPLSIGVKIKDIFEGQEHES
ncbi:MAG TPA: (2Fe-2S)-binding protein [Bacilli bacterium]|nr:MAG: Hydrogen cyanide synthase subunit HcnB [Tenericutes bacterium ADurb.BinA124]HNZ50770.1 (2Fe-2S)-binding protein [Bacilli bacterium]HPN61014.1 (2Fe-2S)-binding protein [Bacilli bacterium]HPX84138.1 (2Fe-2S)-binding protein [Bacilli bacterium]HQC74427.1 (2Fe-2S)-binding protein [Bacilli bacterium]